MRLREGVTAYEQNKRIREQKLIEAGASLRIVKLMEYFKQTGRTTYQEYFTYKLSESG